MLATHGYHVGDGANMRPEARRNILKHVLEKQLPMVGSPAYTNEWGEPDFVKRLSKLMSTLNSLIKGAEATNDGSRDRGIAEWSEDLARVQSTVMQQARQALDGQQMFCAP